MNAKTNGRNARRRTQAAADAADPLGALRADIAHFLADPNATRRGTPAEQDELRRLDLRLIWHTCGDLPDTVDWRPWGEYGDLRPGTLIDLDRVLEAGMESLAYGGELTGNFVDTLMTGHASYEEVPDGAGDEAEALARTVLADGRFDARQYGRLVAACGLELADVARLRHARAILGGLKEAIEEGGGFYDDTWPDGDGDIEHLARLALAPEAPGPHPPETFLQWMVAWIGTLHLTVAIENGDGEAIENSPLMQLAEVAPGEEGTTTEALIQVLAALDPEEPGMVPEPSPLTMAFRLAPEYWPDGDALDASASLRDVYVGVGATRLNDRRWQAALRRAGTSLSALRETDVVWETWRSKGKTRRAAVQFRLGADETGEIVAHGVEFEVREVDGRSVADTGSPIGWVTMMLETTDDEAVQAAAQPPRRRPAPVEWRTGGGLVALDDKPAAGSPAGRRPGRGGAR